MLDLRTPGERYEALYLHLHGSYQADNFLDALVGAEAFFGGPLDHEIVAEAAAIASSPGRLEVVAQRPAVVLDGAKNVAGARASAAAVSEEFGAERSRVMVVGMLGGKDPVEMLTALDATKATAGCHVPPSVAQGPVGRGFGRRRPLARLSCHRGRFCGRSARGGAR